MEVRLFLNEYIDIYARSIGAVYVEIGHLEDTEDGKVAKSENSFTNASFITFLKLMGYKSSKAAADIEKYLIDNDLYIRIRKGNKSNVVALHDIATKEELVTYGNLDELVSVEVLQENATNI